MFTVDVAVGDCPANAGNARTTAPAAATTLATAAAPSRGDRPTVREDCVAVTGAAGDDNAAAIVVCASVIFA